MLVVAVDGRESMPPVPVASAELALEACHPRFRSVPYPSTRSLPGHPPNIARFKSGREIGVSGSDTAACQPAPHDDARHAARARSPSPVPLGGSPAGRGAQAGADATRSASETPASRRAAPVPRNASSTARRAVAADRPPRAGGGDDLPFGLRARKVPTGPVLDPRGSRAHDRGGHERHRSRQRNEVTRFTPRTGREPSVPPPWLGARGSVSRARSANSARGAECARVRAAQREEACRKAGASPLESSPHRSGLVGAVVRRLADAAFDRERPRPARGCGCTHVAPPDRLASPGAHRVVGGARRSIGKAGIAIGLLKPARSDVLTPSADGGLERVRGPIGGSEARRPEPGKVSCGLPLRARHAYVHSAASILLRWARSTAE